MVRPRGRGRGGRHVALFFPRLFFRVRARRAFWFEMMGKATRRRKKKKGEAIAFACTQNTVTAHTHGSERWRWTGYHTRSIHPNAGLIPFRVRVNRVCVWCVCMTAWRTVPTFGVGRGVCRRRGRSAFVLIFFRVDVPSVGAPPTPAGDWRGASRARPGCRRPDPGLTRI